MNKLEEKEVEKLSEHIAKNEMKDLTLLITRRTQFNLLSSDHRILAESIGVSIFLSHGRS